MQLTEPPVSVGQAQSTVPLRWSQLESIDYPTYIANLRGIGCPEETIRDIITADIASLYDQKRKEARAESAPAGVDANALERRLAALWEEQTDLADRLLGRRIALAGKVGQPSANQPVMASAEKPPVIIQPTGSSALPLVLFDPDPSLQFNDRQLARFGTLRERFVAALAGFDGDPSDAEYLRRWNEAKNRMDEQFQQYFGGDAFTRQQIWARRQLSIASVHRGR